MERNLIQQAMGKSMRLLTKLGDSPIIERLGLRDATQRMVQQSVKTGFTTASSAAKLFKSRGKAGQAQRLNRPAPPKLFDLQPTEEQEMMRDGMRRFADEVMRPAAEEADAASATPAELLDHSHGLGITMLAIPEALGGAGQERSAVTNVLVTEQLSRGDMGQAFAMLSPLSVVNAIVDWGDGEQQERYLPAFAEEQFVPAAMALIEPHPLFDPQKLRTGAVRSDDGWSLHGEKTMVALGQSAELLVVAAQVAGVGPRLFLVERGTEGVSVEPDPSMGLRAAGLCRVRFDDVELPRSALLGGEGVAGFDFTAVVDRARIGWGAMAVGVGQAVLDYVIPYCNERHAFGEPITNRQSVAFMIADIAIELECMRLMVYRAASRFDLGKSYRREAYLARLQCADKGMRIGADGVQLLGGHGYVKDHPVERWYRDLRAIGVIEGGLLV